MLKSKKKAFLSVIFKTCLFSKIYILPLDQSGKRVILLFVDGLLAQLGERLRRMQEVTGSIPAGSTIYLLLPELFQEVFYFSYYFQNIRLHSIMKTINLGGKDNG